MDFHGYDAMYYCVKYGSLKCLTKILEMCKNEVPADRTYSKKKRNILTIAALHSNDLEIMKMLLQNPYVKFNTNQTDRF